MSDLNDLVPTSDTITVEMKHPKTGDPLTNDDGSTMTITVFAPHTKEYKAAIYKHANQRIQKSGGNMPEYTYEELDEASTSLLTQVTKEWNITYQGKTPKATPKMVKEIYDKLFWVKPQIEEAIASYTAFTKV
jgi:hypothetical protein